jgi:hypothetical protein
VILSRSRNSFEYFLRTLFPLQYYRCNACENRSLQLNAASLHAWFLMLGDHFMTILLVILFALSVLLAGIHLTRVHGGAPGTGPDKYMH